MLFRSKVVGLLTFTIDRLVTVCEQPTAEVAYAAYAVGLLDPRCMEVRAIERAPADNSQMMYVALPASLSS